MTSIHLSIGFLEPHLLRFGGIRRIIELANRLVARGHDVTIILPPNQRTRCAWMPCTAKVTTYSEAFRRPFDMVIFNEETQWHLLGNFTAARSSGFYALHYASLYGKPGSWESIRTPVSLRLANSEWTADQIANDTCHRPIVLRGGINTDHFRPVDARRKYPILAVGDDRPWKGTDTIREAVASLGLPLETYAHKNLAQSRMAREYSRAEIFVVGSHFEGFGQPGLEALACGTPLVTTDTGGSREYAFHEETALVVPPRDSRAMAAAIHRLRRDRGLRERLAANGLALIAADFNWDDSAERLERIIVDALDRPDQDSLALRPNQRGATAPPLLSVVVLAWDQLHFTQRCVESVRQNTDVPYELIIVDNGSESLAREYARQAADKAHLNDSNLGFSRGMNQGLQIAEGTYTAFINNDTVLPPGWGSLLCQDLATNPRAGVVVPAVTAAGNDRTVRSTVGDHVEVIPPFEAPPSAVVYVMHTATTRELGGWGEEYTVASAEDVDLCFKVWVNGLDILFDERVLVEHVGKGTASIKLPDYDAVWADHRAILLDKWTALEINVPRISSCTEEEFDRNLAIARSVAGWMSQYFRMRDRVPNVAFRQLVLRYARPAVRLLAQIAYRWRHLALVRIIVDIIRSNPRLRRALSKLR